MNKVILSILGHDRPGIVAAVSKILYEQNCNIENVSQTTLQFQFSGIFIVSMSGDLSQQSLLKSLNAQMAPLGLEVHVTSLKPPPTPVSLPECESYIITTKGPDRKGLVAGISEVIAGFGGNITNLQAVFKGGAFASSRVGGLSGAFIPVSEDLNISEAARKGHLGLEKLEANTAVCSVGLDMIALPGDTTEETIAAIIADEMAIGVVNNKTTATRLIPVPGKNAGDTAYFGGLLGQSTIIPVNNGRNLNPFVRHGGLIPAPIQSLTN